MAKTVKPKTAPRQEEIERQRRIIMEIYTSAPKKLRLSRSPIPHAIRKSKRGLELSPLTELKILHPDSPKMVFPPVRKSVAQPGTKKKRKKRHSGLRLESIPGIPIKIELHILKFLVFPGNNSELIRMAMCRRGWVEEMTEKSSACQLIWKPNSQGLQFDRALMGSTCQFINHFEKHSALSNKANLLNNLKGYCDRFKKNVFDYIPITFEFEINSALYLL
jgi:hypothetical protein